MGFQYEVWSKRPVVYVAFGRDMGELNKIPTKRGGLTEMLIQSWGLYFS